MKKQVLLMIVFFATVAYAQSKIVIPSDSKAKYTVLEIGGKWPNRTITTKREGSSGVTYSTRLYNCTESTVKYLGSGDSMEALKASKPDPRMAPIVSGSIADYVGMEACKK